MLYQTVCYEYGGINWFMKDNTQRNFEKIIYQTACCCTSVISCDIYLDHVAHEIWSNEARVPLQLDKSTDVYGAPFVKILCMTDLAQKCYLCAYLAISAQRQLSLRAFSYLCTCIAKSACIYSAEVCQRKTWYPV